MTKTLLSFVVDELHAARKEAPYTLSNVDLANIVIDAVCRATLLDREALEKTYSDRFKSFEAAAMRYIESTKVTP